jgi:hypothetical protein
MSLRRWNSVAERAQLQRYVLLAEMMLEEEEDSDLINEYLINEQRHVFNKYERTSML